MSGREMITPIQFAQATGFNPEDDDMERVNCDRVGTKGHISCGWCDKHAKPRFLCHCIDLSRVTDADMRPVTIHRDYEGTSK